MFKSFNLDGVWFITINELLSLDIIPKSGWTKVIFEIDNDNYYLISSQEFKEEVKIDLSIKIFLKKRGFDFINHRKWNWCSKAFLIFKSLIFILILIVGEIIAVY